jgi:hypothetical protein
MPGHMKTNTLSIASTRPLGVPFLSRTQSPERRLPCYCVISASLAGKAHCVSRHLLPLIRQDKPNSDPVTHLIRRTSLPPLRIVDNGTLITLRFASHDSFSVAAAEPCSPASTISSHFSLPKENFRTTSDGDRLVGTFADRPCHLSADLDASHCLDGLMGTSVGRPRHLSADLDVSYPLGGLVGASADRSRQLSQDLDGNFDFVDGEEEPADTDADLSEEDLSRRQAVAGLFYRQSVTGVGPDSDSVLEADQANLSSEAKPGEHGEEGSSLGLQPDSGTLGDNASAESQPQTGCSESTGLVNEERLIYSVADPAVSPALTEPELPTSPQTLETLPDLAPAEFGSPTVTNRSPKPLIDADPPLYEPTTPSSPIRAPTNAEGTESQSSESVGHFRTSQDHRTVGLEEQESVISQLREQIALLREINELRDQEFEQIATRVHLAEKAAQDRER